MGHSRFSRNRVHGTILITGLTQMPLQPQGLRPAAYGYTIR